DDERIDIVVEDDGSGFDADAAQSMARGQTITTFGLAGIIGRTEMLGGRLSIDSSPDHGTKLMVSIPLDS
ncbi:MAG: sensor histidine kinase, partial [Dehalococcoidia bacterium]|nr:sensor histidine kinase [Dehalococcoidia bacterium]